MRSARRRRARDANRARRQTLTRDEDRHGRASFGPPSDRCDVKRLATALTSHRASSRPMFKKVLIANRAEIAVADRAHLQAPGHGDGGHLQRRRRGRRALPRLRRGGAHRTRRRCADSYLNIAAILAAADATGADAIHPGYGLLSESPEFARAVRASRASPSSGPRPEVMLQAARPRRDARNRGQRRRARRRGQRARGGRTPRGRAGRFAEEFGYPVRGQDPARRRRHRPRRAWPERPGRARAALARTQRAQPGLGDGRCTWSAASSRAAPRRGRRCVADEQGDVDRARRPRVQRSARVAAPGRGVTRACLRRQRARRAHARSHLGRAPALR